MTRKSTTFFIALLGFAALFSAPSLFAQQITEKQPEIRSDKETHRREGRPNLFRELGLSTEQIVSIRKIYADGKAEMKAAQEKLREAGRALDRAIYADVLDEGSIQLLLEDQKTAHAEVLRLKYLGELEVRKVLTPEQLTKFRELRSRFEKHRKIKVRTVGSQRQT